VRYRFRCVPGGLLPHLFTLTGVPKNPGGLFSVALAFPRLLVRGILLSQKDSLLCVVRTFLSGTPEGGPERLPETVT